MSCFQPDSSNRPGSNPLTVPANDRRMTYLGIGWTSNLAFRVSGTAGDSASLTFTGTSIQVFGEMPKNQHAKALFGIDSLNGGTTCDNDNIAQKGLLFDASSLSAGVRHTLLITNQLGTLSLNSLEVFGGSETSTSISTAQTSIPSTRIPSQPATSTPSLPGSDTSTSDSASRGVGASMSPTLLPLPLPQSSSDPPQSSLSNTMAANSAETGESHGGGPPSYTVSSYTKVTTTGGNVTTIVIQTTVEVPQTQPYHGPSRGAVAGVAVGGLLFLFLLAGAGLWWWRRRRNRVRFLYGISNLDFDPAMMTRSSAELPSQGGARVRDSDATLYTGDTLSPYKRPVSYSYLALDVKKHPPSDSAIPAAAGDRRLSTRDEPSPPRLPEKRSLCESHSASGQESMESVIPPSEERHEAL